MPMMALEKMRRAQLTLRPTLLRLLLVCIVCLPTVSAWVSPTAVATPSLTASTRRQPIRFYEEGPLHAKRKAKRKQSGNDVTHENEPSKVIEKAGTSSTSEEPIKERPLLEDFSFDSYDPSIVDMDQLPVPFFTTLIITIFSLFFWGYIFYVGIVGLPVDEATTSLIQAPPPSL